MEQWLPINDFPDYMVSSMGRVKSTSPRKGARAARNDGILAGYVRTIGRDYRRAVVTLRKEGKTYYRPIHQLVLEAFAGERPAGMGGLHNNGDSLDNRAENLRWGTPAENAQDAKSHGTFSAPPVHSGETHPRSTLSSQQVAEIRSHTFSRGDQAAFARKYGVAEITINRIRRGVSRLAG